MNRLKSSLPCLFWAALFGALAWSHPHFMKVHLKEGVYGMSRIFAIVLAGMFIAWAWAPIGRFLERRMLAMWYEIIVLGLLVGLLVLFVFLAPGIDNLLPGRGLLEGGRRALRARWVTASRKTLSAFRPPVAPSSSFAMIAAEKPAIAAA